MSAPLEKCVRCGVRKLTVSPRLQLCWQCHLADHLTRCQCVECDCQILLSEVEAGVCIDCHLGEHEEGADA